MNRRPQAAVQVDPAKLDERGKLAHLTARVGGDPLLTQASTGNSSIKIEGVLWIKSSGKWMADAIRQEIQVPLDLEEMQSCLRRNLDPAAHHAGASLETAMHAALPQRIVLHVHCVDTIAWAVRSDAEACLARRLDGLRWQWIPYVASGLPLARRIQGALAARSRSDVFVLGNHGLVVAGADCEEVADRLRDVRERLAIFPRQAHPADYTALTELAEDSPWELPDDDEIHGLGTDTVSQAILAGGFLYPCQALFSQMATPDLFRPVPCPNPLDAWWKPYAGQPFVMVQGRGVLVQREMSPAELAMISGLARVVQRIPKAASLQYLSGAEAAAASGAVAQAYRELANLRAAAG